jgi:hypothetical protein
MTAREVYEGILVETNKQGAPDIFPDEFNYIMNKSIQQWINKRYNVYDLNQQTSDDLQVLKGTTKINKSSLKSVGSSQIIGGVTLTEAKYNFKLPANYYHLLNCVLTYELAKDFKCYTAGSKLRVPTKRITSDKYASILNNAWLRPQYKSPYHMVQDNENQIIGDWENSNTYQNSKVSDSIKTLAGKNSAHNSYEDTNGDSVFNTGDKLIGPTMLIDYGTDNSLFILDSVEIQYLKVPSQIRITPAQLDRTEDFSQVMEFPDYVCRQIINEAVPLFMLRSGDPTLQAHTIINKSIPDVPGTGGNQQRS